MFPRIFRLFFLSNLLATFSIFSGPASAADSEIPDLPISRIQLFTSGVGYFEHQGTLDGEATVQLRFKTDQVNDVLKSLLLIDRGGGKIGTVVYPSQDPLSKILESFQVNLGQDRSLSQILGRLQGSRIAVQSSGETFEGVILGIETRMETDSETDRIKEVPVVNLLAGGRLRSFELEEISSLEFLDPKVQKELEGALELIAGQRGEDTKPISLNFEGEGERPVLVGYLLETPVWKTSYRLVLPATDEEEGYLQGWAIVENQTDNDWEGVELSLISGQPISFIQDLYQPLYAERPVVQPELGPRIAPPTYEGGMAGYAVEAVPAAAAPPAPKPGRPYLTRKGAEVSDEYAAAEPESLGFLQGDAPVSDSAPYFYAGAGVGAGGGVEPAAETAEVGELFEYRVADVSLPRQKSALIPIVGQSVKVDRVSIFNKSVHDKHPLNGVRLINETGLHLQNGPVTVLDGNSYAGDARLSDLPDGQERLLSYAIDQKVQVIHEGITERDSTYLTGSIREGVLHLQKKFREVQHYKIENRSDGDREILVEHPFLEGWELVDTPDPVETTSEVYRFSVPVVAGATEWLAIRRERPEMEVIALLHADIGRLNLFLQMDQIPESVREELRKAADFQKQLADLARQINEREQRIAEITAEQERIRANMNTIQDRQSNYYQRLLKKLDEQETELEALRLEIENLRQEENTVRTKFSEYLNKLEVG